jgi:PAS domain S-box-containing protein
MQRGTPTILDKRDSITELTPGEGSVVFADGVQQVIAVPVGAKGGTIGVAILASEQTVDATVPEHEKIELCQAIAKQGALAIENIQAVESIAREGRLIQLIIDNVADGVFSTDLAGNIVAFNPAAEEITGFKAEEVIGRNYATVLAGKPEQDQRQAETDELLQQMVADQPEPTAVHRRTWIVRKDGQQVRVAHSMAPLINQNGQITGTVSVVRDVSKEEELVRLKSEFISLVSHQLRTPLTSISASAELLAGNDLNTASRTNLVQTLTQQTSRLKRLVNQVLEASRLETGEIKLLLEPLALSPLIEQTVRIHRTQHPSHEFEIRSPKTPLIVMGDRESLEIVLDNLLQNAVNYSPKNSRVTVTVEDKPDEIVIGVADEGVGIPEEHIEHIFERFRRLPSSKRGTGFGLGLHITKMLVEKQGGQIWVESEVGRGSCFYFALRKLGDFNE